MNSKLIRRLCLGGLIAPAWWSALQFAPLFSGEAFAQDDEEAGEAPRVRPVPIGPPMGGPGRTGIEVPPGGGTSASAPRGPGGPEADDAPSRPDEARQKPPILDRNAKVTIDFVDADLSDIIKYMAEIPGRNFILGEKLSGKITIISHEKVTVAEA